MSTDFEKADKEASELANLVPVGLETNLGVAPKDMMELKTKLVAKYHEGNDSLVGKLNAQGKNNLQNLVMALVDEVIKETDALLGNELIATKVGNLRDASIISFKRSEVLEKAIKAVQSKQMFEREHGIDVESPAMKVVFQYFMRKVKLVFEQLQYDDEASDIFFRTLGNSMEFWKKEIQEELDAMVALG